ncbi:P-loop containing nucleoside triphosphate hydrolase protein [Pilobolus umbonatus]|nr:P-loop containing nucleoside triphosphate hydrolase protein [Pilobolus umbonatus]
MTLHVNLKVCSGTNNQYVEVTKDVWNSLIPQDYTKDSIAISISVPSLAIPTPISQSKKLSKNTSFIAHCRPTAKGENGVHASGHLLKAVYGSDALYRLDEEEDDEDSSCIVELKATELIELDELILGARSSSSYAYAQKNHTALTQQLIQDPVHILRSEGIIHLDEGYSFEVLMSHPVQQGYISCAEHTRVMIIDISEDTEEEEEEQPTTPPSILSPHFNLLNPTTPMPAINEPQEFNAEILKKKWPETRLYPTPTTMEDEESRVFMDVKDLVRCGVFSGEWALVSANNPKKSRLCKVYGIDDVNGLHKIYLSPSLYFNLDLPPNEESKVTVTRVHSPPTEGPPVASAITIARVASPSSMDKNLQSSFLDSLKHWFEEKERILCKGDVIGIGLNEEDARINPTDEDIKVYSSKPTTIVYFQVARLSPLEDGFLGMGRRIVPTKTQMVQTGVEYSRVPTGSISHYYDFTEKLPFQRSQSEVYNQIHELVASSLHPLGRDFELSCNALFHGPRGGGKSTLVREVAEDLGVHYYGFSVYDIVSDTDAKTEVHLRAKFDKVAALAPCIMLIGHIEGLAKKSAVVESGQEPLLATVLQECINQLTHNPNGYPVMVIATTGDIDTLPSSVLSCFRHEIAMTAPDEKTRLQIIENLLYDSPLAPDVSLANLATQTAALVAKDLVDLVGRAGVLSLQRIDRSIHQETDELVGNRLKNISITADDILAAGITLTVADFDAALGEARASYSDSIGAPKIPNVTWDDVGGLAHVKDDILDTIQLPLEHPELFGSGLKKRSGILLYGPPGTGKTLLAKAIATSCSLNFFSVKGPELLNMYIGESEANVRRVFQRARDAKPCVIFFDELDSVAPKRGEKGDSGGVMDRIVSQLLAELDGMGEGESGAGDVFVIGATNRPDLLDPALLRPGRFDKLLYLGVSQDHESQLRIIQALTRKFRLHPDLDLRKVADRCPFHYTGADFYALCSDAMLKAMVRVADSIEEKVRKLNEEKRSDLPQPVTVQYYLSHLVIPEEIIVQVQEVDFIKALEELIPSVSATELAHYSKVREKFEKVEEKEEVKVEPPKPRKNKGKEKARA